MKIAVIGTGFTGLAAAHRLIQQGYEVTLIEKDSFPGGLAIGFQEPKWQWSIEKHYHHWFTNDHHVLTIAKEIHHPVIIKRPTTSVYVDKKTYQMDSPSRVLRFSKLTLPQRLRMALVLGMLRYNPFWQLFENIKTSDFLKKSMGNKPYEMLWEPQLKNKFGLYANAISLAWFWARIKKRTPDLAYPMGGFLSFANTWIAYLLKKNVHVLYNTQVIELQSNDRVSLRIQNIKTKKITTQTFDNVIVTLPSFLFSKIAPQLPKDYVEKLNKLKGLGALNLVIRLKKQFLTDDTYWLSICQKNAPVMAIVEHTNFMDKKFYNNEHVVYAGNYLPLGHRYFTMSPEELLHMFDPILTALNPQYKKNIIAIHPFAASFAQPIIPTGYSHLMPKFTTPLQNVYLANIQQVYPWDRGTNYAVELGEKVAKLIDEK